MSVITLPPTSLPAMQFTAGNRYVGTPGKTIIGSTSPLWVVGAGVTLQGISLDGNGIVRNANIDGLTIDNCEIRNARVAVEANGGSGITIRNSLIEKCGFATWLSDQSNLLIENNEVREVGYGFKCFGNSPSNKNWIARRNSVHDLPQDTMAFEWQGQCDGWLIEENLIEKLRFGPNLADNDHALIISAPMALSRNGKVRRNVVIGNKPRDGGYPGAWMSGQPLLLEIGGGTNSDDQTIVELNILNGGGTGISATDKDGACVVSLRNNRIVNVYRIWDRSGQQQVGVINCGENVDVGFTVEQARAWAGRNIGIVPQGNPDPAPTPTPTPVPNAPQKITLSVDIDLKTLNGSNLKISGGALPSTL